MGPAPHTPSSSEATGCVRISRTSRTALGEPHLSFSLSLSLSLPLSLRSDDPHGSLFSWEFGAVVSSGAYDIFRFAYVVFLRIGAIQQCRVPQYAVRARLNSCTPLVGRNFFGLPQRQKRDKLTRALQVRRRSRSNYRCPVFDSESQGLAV